MTAALVVSQHGKQIEKSIVEKECFVIGRSKRADLVLDDGNISREHALILLKDNIYFIQDRGSRNGTLVNGSAIAGQVSLKEGDVVTVGPFEIKFMEEGGARVFDDDEESKTRFAGVPAPTSEKQSKRKVTRGSANQHYRLVATEGPIKGTSYIDWDGALTLGRSSESTVVLSDDAVSQNHARIWEEDGIFFIEDLGSSNGTFVQGVRIQNTRLKTKQRIRIGSSTFMFTAVDPERRKFLLAITAVSALFLCILLAVVVMLTPEDQLGAIFDQGRQQVARGEYADAQETFEKILEIQPDHAKAEKAIAYVKKALARDAKLAEAEDLAENEQYDAALDICYKLTRENAKYDKAKELQEVIMTVKDAQIAFNAQNWPDAILNLKKARQAYPKATLLAKMLERAQSEEASQATLTQAKEYITHNQSDSAQEVLLGIPMDSVYRIEADGLLQSLRTDDEIAVQIATARNQYKKGDIAKALTTIEGGLAQQPEHRMLLNLKAHISRIAPLARKILNADSLVDSDDISAIKRMIESCDQIISIEADASVVCRQQAIEVQSDLGRRLGEIEESSMTRAEMLLDEGDQLTAYTFFVRALDAAPDNSKAREVIAEIRSEVAAECKKHFQEGLVHEDLGQTELAIAAYEKVLVAGLEDDDYYERASRKLDQLRR